MLTDSETNTELVQSIIALAKEMSLVVVAEGVETDRQYAILRTWSAISCKGAT
jgi:sensor c-di-GMP phosphodiesterase-like protein